MTVTYFQLSTASDLTGPSGTGGTTRHLVADRADGGGDTGLATGNMNSSVFCNQNFFTPSGDPGTDGNSTGSFSVAIRISVQNANIGIRVFLARVNAAGTVQGSEVEATGGSQTAGAASRTFSWTNPGLGTWASGNRLRIRVQLTNTSGSMNQSCTINVDSSSDTIATPFTAPTTTGTLSETQDNQTLAASGTVTPPGVTGTLSETQDNQTLAGYGLVGGFPKVVGRAFSAGGETTSHTVSLPDNIQSGELLLVHFVVDGSPTITWPLGWEPIADRGHNDGAASKSAAAYRIVDGTEGFGASNNSISVGTSTSEAAAHRSWRITNWHGTTPPEAASAIGSSANPDPPSLSPSWGGEDTLWLALCGSENWLSPVTGHPTNYHVPFSGVSFGGAGGADNIIQGAAERGLNTATENPGTFTITSSRVWAAFTVAVRPQDTATTGTLAETQDNQTLAASGQLGHPGTLAETQDNQTLAASGTVTGAGVSGSLAETQDNQTLAASGQLGLTGSLAETQGNQTLAASGQLGLTGSLAETQGNQTLAASGTVTPPPVTGSLAETQDNQTLAASGIVGDATVGTLNETQDNQTLAASGKLGLTGSLAETQGDQTLAASGSVVGNTTGSLSETQDDQTLAASGKLGLAGNLAETQDDQTLAASGLVLTGIFGSLDKDQRDQTLVASGTVVAPPRITGWRGLKAILDSRRSEFIQSKIDEEHLCPFDGEPLETREDGAMFCQFDGVIEGRFNEF